MIKCGKININAITKSINRGQKRLLSTEIIVLPTIMTGICTAITPPSHIALIRIFISAMK